MMPPAIEATLERYALCIGVNHAPGLQMDPLGYAHADAQAMYELLLTRDFAPSNTHLLVGERASTTEIAQVLQVAVLSRPKKQDLVLVYFAGHGIRIACPDEEEDEEVSSDVFLVSSTFDLQTLKQDRGAWMEYPLRLWNLRTRFLEQTRSKKVLFLLDSCHSGDFFGKPYRDLPPPPQESINSSFARMSAGRIVLSSCMPQQKAYEDATLGHGRFTHFVLRALRGEERGAPCRNGTISVGSLFDYLSAVLPATQRPVKGGVEQGSFDLWYVPQFDECPKTHPAPVESATIEQVLEAFTHFETSQKQENEEIKGGLASLDQQVTLLSQRVTLLASSIGSSDIAVQKMYRIVIDQSKHFLDQFKPKSALSHLENLRKDAWGGADTYSKWAILTNIASAKMQLNQEKEGARLFIEAAQYNRNDERAICGLALGYLFLDNFSEAERYIEEALQKNPISERAYALKIRVKTLQNENFDTIVELIPEELRSLQEIASSLGDAARTRGDGERSQQWNEIAYNNNNKSPDIVIAYATSMLAPIAENKLVVFSEKVTPDVTKRLATIIAMYNEAYKNISDSEYMDLKLECLFNRAVSYRLMGDYENAAKDLDLAIEIATEKDKFLFQRAELALASGKKSFAISLLESMKESKNTPAAPLLAEVYQETDSAKGLETLIHYLEQNTSDTFKEQANRLLVEFLLTSENYEEADNRSETLLAAHPRNVRNLLLRAKVLRSLGKEKDAKNCLIQVKELINNSSPFQDILALADHYYSFSNYENAALFYELIADISFHNYITRNLLECHYKLGNEKRVVEICSTLRQQHGALKVITPIEVDILERIGNVEKAAEVCRQYIQHYPDELSMQLRLAFIHLRVQNFFELDNFLRQKHTTTHASLKEKIHLSELLSIRGFHDEALDLIYETRRMFFDEYESHLQYITIFFRREYEGDQLLAIETVAKDTAVCIRNYDDTKRWYIIEERKDAKRSNNEFDLGHPLAQVMLGKKVGDRIVLVEAPQKKEGIIEEIKSKYIHAFHESTLGFETNFPHVKGFNVFNLTLPQNPHDTNVSIILDLVDQQQDHLHRFLDFYKDGNLTIGTLARLLGRNPIETWGLLLNASSVGVRNAVGEHQERASARRVLTKKNSKLVVDITSLLTMRGLAMESQVIKFFGKIAIAQTTVDQITSFLNSKKGLGEKGFMTIGKEGDRYVQEEISSEQVKKNREYLEGILLWMKENCEIIPCYEALKIRAGHRNNLYNIFGTDAIDTVLIAQQEEALILSEDEQLRNYAKAVYNVDGVWMQMILECLLENGEIDNKTYQIQVIKLINSNYHYISISAETLEEAANQALWKPEGQFIKVAEVLSGTNSNGVSAIHVAVNFIYKLYTKQFYPSDPDHLLFTLLDLLFQSRTGKMALLGALKKQLWEKFHWLPFQQQRVQYGVDQWTRRQAIG